MNNTQLPFLDVMVIKNNTTIATNIYYKSTNTHQYLNFKSSSPTHIKHISFCPARKICNIVDDINTIKTRLIELKRNSAQAKLPSPTYRKQHKHAKELTVEELRTTQER